MLEQENATLQSKSIASASHGKSYGSAMADSQRTQSTQDAPSANQSPLQRLVNNSPQVMQAKANQELANDSEQSQEAMQFHNIANGASDPNEGEEEGAGTPQQNNTGLPDKLKAGIENMSGQSLDDVKVHFNSAKPAQFQAHAYAQGTDIHLGAGQEKHLPHEAWHVAQQKQGRVQPTSQLKGNVNVNDDAGLEKEADVMGAKAASFGGADKPQDEVRESESLVSTAVNSGTMQLISDGERASFYDLKARYHNDLKRNVNAGAPKQDRRLCHVAVEQFWKEISNQYSAGSFSQMRWAEFTFRANDLHTLVDQEFASATALQLALDNTTIAQDVEYLNDNYKAYTDYHGLIQAFHDNIENGTVGAHQAASLATIEWLRTHTTERDEEYSKIDNEGGEPIDLRQWQQYQLDVKQTLNTDAAATAIFNSFEALNPGWLGGQGVARLDEQLEKAIESLEYAAGWTDELEAAVPVVVAAFVDQSSTEKQQERNEALDAIDAADKLATDQAAKAAQDQAVEDAKPQLSDEFTNAAWSTWGGSTGFQIPKSFYLKSTSGTIVYFQSNQDVTAKHLREYLQQERDAGRPADGPRALAYLNAMRAEFMQLTDYDINDNSKVRPKDWEFLFKADEGGDKTRRTCYHIVPKSGTFHT